MNLPLRKRQSFKIKRSADCNRSHSCKHPLHSAPDHPQLDSDLDSILDSSSNESIMSNTSRDSLSACSVLPCSSTFLRTSLSPAEILKPLVIASASTSPPTSSYSRLLSLIKQSQIDLSQQYLSQQYLRQQYHAQPAANIPSAEKLGRWRTFLETIMMLSMFSYSPRNTDDSVPTQETDDKHRDCPTLDPATGPNRECDLVPLADRELDTFSAQAPPTDEVAIKCCKLRNRDCRINCDFLKRYALDCAARQDGLLPNAYSDREHSRLLEAPALRQFDKQYGLDRISNISREKLWELVILPPRDDGHPAGSIDYSTYTFVGPAACDRGSASCIGSSVATKNGNYIPWATHRTSLKPAGTLANAVPLINRASPTGGTSRTQYTIRGWCNDRWMSSN